MSTPDAVPTADARAADARVADLRARRVARGMTQRELALASGVPQPNVSAYESGRRRPSAETLERLDAALGVPLPERVAAARDEVLAAAERRGLADVRVFGSVGRGDATAASDLDLLVHPGPASSALDLAAFMAEVEQIVGVRVDVVSDRGTGPTMDRIRGEAVPL